MNLKSIKILILSIFSVINIHSLHINLPSDNSTAIQAVFEVCEEFFIKQSIEFDIIGFGSLNDTLMLEIIDKIENFIQLPHQVRIFEPLSESELESLKSESSLLILSKPALVITSEENLNQLQTQTKLAKFNGRPIKFLTFVYDGKIPELELESFISMGIGRFHHYEYFLLNETDKITLKIFEWFTPNACNQIQTVTINTFDKTIQKWERKLENHEKFRNFHNCELSLAVFNHTVNFYPDRFTDRKLGVAVAVFNGTAQIGNFSVNFYKTNPPNYEPSEVQAYLHLKFTHSKVHEQSLTFYQESLQVAVTPNPPYTIYQKLFLPFDEATWGLFIASFVIAFVVIFVVNFMPQSIKNKVYGMRVKTPSMNIFYIFFGFGQVHVPRESFARFLLINFLFLCIIFRTCYQSKLYEFMSDENMREPPPKTIEDVLRKNYEILTLKGYFYNQTVNLIGNENRYRITSYPVSTDFLRQYYDLVRRTYRDHTEKKAFVMQAFQFRQIQATYYIKPTLLKDSFFTVQIGLISSINHFLFNLTSRVTRYFIDTGILQYTSQYAEWMLWRQTYHEDTTVLPRTLELKDLSFGFYIWLAACGISIVGYFLEVLRFKMRRPLRKLSGLIQFILLVRERMQYYRM